MILVIGTPPIAGTARDGMLQRTAAVDALFGDEPRIYLEPRVDEAAASRFDLAPRGEHVSYGTPNVLDLRQFRQLFELAVGARVVVAHSIYWAQYVLPLYALGHVVTDLHGAVPEEEICRGNPAASAFLARVERFVLAHSLAVVVVSEAMRAHFQRKYPDVQTRAILLPVAMRPRVPVDRAQAPPWKLVYAGHMSVWQNVDQMLEAVRTTAVPWEMQVLAPDPAQFNAIIASAGLGDRINAKAAAFDEVPTALEQAHLSFVLRDGHIVNRVACPTKLGEALACGNVPVVKDPNIGDFVALGYRWVNVDDFVAGRLPAASELAAMSAANRQAAGRLFEIAEAGARELSSLLATQPLRRAASVGDEPCIAPWLELLARGEEQRQGAQGVLRDECARLSYELWASQDAHKEASRVSEQLANELRGLSDELQASQDARREAGRVSEQLANELRGLSGELRASQDAHTEARRVSEQLSNELRGLSRELQTSQDAHSKLRQVCERLSNELQVSCNARLELEHRFAAHVMQVEQERDDLKAQLDVILRTRSWRVTKPLRAAAQGRRALRIAIEEGRRFGAAAALEAFKAALSKKP